MRPIRPFAEAPRPDAPQSETLATRQTLPQVAYAPSAGDRLVGIGGVALIALLGLATFWTMRGSRVERVQAAPVAVVNAAPVAGPLRPFTLPAGAVTALPPSGFAPATRAAAGNSLAAPGVVFDASGASAFVLPSGAAAPAAPAPANANEEFAARAAAANGTAVASASFDPASTVSQGTLIPAILETAIDTDVPGYVRAIVSADVRSFDGGRVLVPRSSRLIGQYKSGLQAGQRRVYVIWARLIRPDGVSVTLGSPGTGFDGQSGLGGQVSTHFFERFGSAMLLSVISGLSAVTTGSTNIVIAGGGQSAAAAAVGQTGQIGPTIRVRPGEPIRVFTARDLDFSRVTPK